VTFRRLPTAGVLAHLAVAVLVTSLGAVGALPRWAGLTHLVALPPLDVAADLRWLLARAPSYPLFALGLATALTVRVGVLALLLGRGRRPRWRMAAGLYGAALVPALLAAQFDVIARTALYSRLFGAAVTVLTLTFLMLAAAPWTGERGIGAGIRRGAVGGFRVVDLAVYAALLLGLGTLAEVGGSVVAVALVPVSAGLTLAIAARLAAPAPGHALLRLAVAATVAASVVAAVVATRGMPWTVSDADRPGSVMIMSGINSASGQGAIFELEPERIGYDCDQVHYYSYAGTGTGQPRGAAACPVTTGAPYVPEDTQRPFDEQVRLLEAQIEPLEEPVAVLAHSQAAWVAWQAAADGRLEGVEHLVLVGPFPSSPLAFPPPGEDGTGRVAGDLFRLLEPVPELVDFDFDVDAPLTHELLAAPDAASEVFAAPVDGIEVLSVTASSDLALMPDGWRIAGATDACPVREAHPYLPITPAFHHVVDAFLDGERGEGGCPPWPELYRLASQALAAPPHDA
jgi:hypothetical protein